MLVEPQFRTKFGDAVWSAKARLHRMLTFEQCIANGQAKFGLIPAESAHIINSIHVDSVPEFFEVFDLATKAGNPAIPFVDCLRTAVGVLNSSAASHVHLGITSQDLIDTSMMLALADIFDEISANLLKIEKTLVGLAKKYKSSPALARTLHQHATPTTFGLKSATWAMGVHQARKRVERARSKELIVQLGGAAGVLTLMKPHGPAVRAYLAAKLQLVDPGHSWHTNRSHVLDACSTLAQVSGPLAKIAKDCVLMMQPELAELAEKVPASSSAMPHKNNPVGPLFPLAILPVISGQLSTISTGQAHSHERTAGNWHTEWIVIPSISSLTLASVERTLSYLSGLRIDESRMAKNLNRTGGILGAAELQHLLAKSLGYKKSDELLQPLLHGKEDQTLTEKALANPEVVETLGRGTLQETLSYKEHVKECEQEAMRIIQQISSA